MNEASEMVDDKRLVSPISSTDTARLLAGSIALLVVGWALAIFAFGSAHFAVLAPDVVVGVEGAAAMARLFGALILALFPYEPGASRLHWVAAGFGVLGLGGLVFGSLQPLLFGALDFNTAVYAALMVRTLACILFVIGLIPSTPPAFTREMCSVILALSITLALVIVNYAAVLPPLVGPIDLKEAVSAGDNPLRGLTAWHWGLSLLPLGLAIAATWGTDHYMPRGKLGPWLLIAMILQAGANLHTMFWPSVYSQVLTTADLLRLLVAAVVAVGGILELRRIAAEHAKLLAVAQEQARRLHELALLKADFSAMVVHELSAPIAAIRGQVTMLATGQLDSAAQAQAVAAIQAETTVLAALVNDVHVAATIERPDFAIRPRPVALRQLLADAASFAQTLPDDHPIVLETNTAALVRADPERIGQVLRNLLSNAAKYSPAGAPIQLRVSKDGRRIRIEVVDRGQGIHPDDLQRVFEKFGRGRDTSGRKVPGVGLGLYLSRQIVRAHGTDLSVESALNEGSIFAFELEVAE